MANRGIHSDQPVNTEALVAAYRDWSFEKGYATHNDLSVLDLFAKTIGLSIVEYEVIVAELFGKAGKGEA